MITILTAFAFLCTRPRIIDPSLAQWGSKIEPVLRSTRLYSDHKNNCLNARTPHKWGDIPTYDSNKIVGRRKWLRGILVSPALQSIAARAYDSSSLLSPLAPPSAIPVESAVANKAAICDPTIESYRKGSNQIHIVGTAHISSVSAQLSGEAVRETKPDAVFLELDLQRISRAFRDGQINRPVTILFFTGENPDGGGTIALRSAILAPQDLQPRGLAKFLQKFALKNPIQDMYEGLEAQGITPGEEFVTAVEEGVKLDSLIILGDRRMDITLRRLTNALVFHTDPKKLVEADHAISLKLNDQMPELAQLEEQLKQKKKGEWTGEDLAMFVERMKTKETTMEIMKEIQKAAPELHQALVGERDVYMARAMDTMFSSSLQSILPPSSMSPTPSSIHTIVAVVGLGHISGVGRELKSLGWRQFTPPQC